MGCCATKPKVLKDAGPAPLTPPEQDELASTTCATDITEVENVKPPAEKEDEKDEIQAEEIVAQVEGQENLQDFGGDDLTEKHTIDPSLRKDDAAIDYTEDADQMKKTTVDECIKGTVSDQADDIDEANDLEERFGVEVKDIKNVAGKS